MKFLDSFSAMLFLGLFVILHSSHAQDRIKERIVTDLWEDFTYAWENMDAEACADFYLEDGLNVPPELPENIGKKAIEIFYRGLFESNQESKYRHKSHYVEQHGELMVEYGQFEVDWLPKTGEAWQYRARTLVHWGKDESGAWKIKTLIFNQIP